VTRKPEAERPDPELVEAAAALKNFKPDDVAAGQKYVAAYVEYIHAVEKVQEAAASAAHDHAPQTGPRAHHH
jgi:hypothetical protein